MTRRKTILTVIGLAGCAATGYGFYQVAISTSCGPGTGLTCPPDAPFFLLMLGMFAAIITMAVGAGAVVFVGLFLAIGAGLGLGGLRIESGEGTTLVIIGASLLSLGLLPLLVIPFVRHRQRRMTRLVKNGVPAVGTVTSIRDTGMTVNHNPRVALGMRIEPRDGSAAFDAEKTFTVPRVKLPRVGQCFPVWFDSADRDDFVFGADVTPGASPEVRELFAAAQAAEATAAEHIADAARTQAAGPRHDPPSRVDPLERLAKLNQLRQAGALTEAEFEREKAKLLGVQ